MLITIEKKSHNGKMLLAIAKNLVQIKKKIECLSCAIIMFTSSNAANRRHSDAMKFNFLFIFSFFPFFLVQQAIYNQLG